MGMATQIHGTAIYECLIHSMWDWSSREINYWNYEFFIYLHRPPIKRQPQRWEREMLHILSWNPKCLFCTHQRRNCDLVKSKMLILMLSFVYTMVNTTYTAIWYWTENLVTFLVLFRDFIRIYCPSNLQRNIWNHPFITLSFLSKLYQNKEQRKRKTLVTAMKCLLLSVNNWVWPIFLQTTSCLLISLQVSDATYNRRESLPLTLA